jgi:hypothetical protein
MGTRVAAEEFPPELRALYEAAGKPTLERLVRLGKEQTPKTAIADSTISDWLTATTVPTKHQRYFLGLVASFRRWPGRGATTRPARRDGGMSCFAKPRQNGQW